jgi:hypothetical protein
MVIVEFVEVFHHQGFIMDSQIDDIKSTLIFWSTDHIPVWKAFSMDSIFLISPQELSATLLKMNKDGNWDLK